TLAWTWLRKLAANPTDRMVLGERGEKLAEKFLRRQGYKILVRRFKGRGGEIDLICRQGEWLGFVGVKTRKTGTYGAPSEDGHWEKRKHASKTALEYLRLLENPQVRWRFDIVEVIMPDSAPAECRLIQNAFDLSEPFIY